MWILNSEKQHAYPNDHHVLKILPVTRTRKPHPLISYSPIPVQALISCPDCPNSLLMCVSISFLPQIHISHLHSSYFLTNNRDHGTACLEIFQNLLQFLHCTDTFHSEESEIFFAPSQLKELFQRYLCHLQRKRIFPTNLNNVLYSGFQYSLSISYMPDIKKKKFIFSFESSLPLLKYKCLKTVLCSFFLYLQYSLEQRSPTFWHQGPVCERVFPGMLRGDGFGMVLIRSAKPRSLACTVHSRIHPPMRIECYR